MEPRSPIQTIIFDLGGVILPFDHTLIPQRLQKYCSFSPADIRNVFFGDGLVQRYCLGEITSESFFKEVQKTLDLHCHFDQFALAWSDIFTENQDISGLIRRLSRRYPLYLLSDTNELHFQFIRSRFPVLQCFRDFILSYEVRARKPQPAIYEEAIRRAGTQPAEMVFIDDLEANAKGAEAAGMKGIWFQGCERLMRELRELNVEV